jgi:DNA-binding transcriptional MerR regulator
MSITEAAAAVGRSADTLRRLERTGVLDPAPRDRNNHRVYTRSDIGRIERVLYPHGTRGGVR